VQIVIADVISINFAILIASAEADSNDFQTIWISSSRTVTGATSF
jgi:hypothetical protein